jgi:hypothetical protein
MFYTRARAATSVDSAPGRAAPGFPAPPPAIICRRLVAEVENAPYCLAKKCATLLAAFALTSKK